MSRCTCPLVPALAALLVLAPPAAGQGLEIGAEAGLNLADLSVEDDEGNTETETRTGLRVGAVMRWSFSSLLGLQAGGYYSEKGATAVEAGTDLAIDLTYVEVPLLLTLSVPTGPSPLAPRVYAGPQIAFESSCDLEGTSGPVSVSTSCEQAAEEGIGLDPATDVGLVFGGGLDVAAGPGAFTLDARYDLGLVDINDFEGTEDLKTRTFSVSAGYLIGLP